VVTPNVHAATIREALVAWGNRLNKYGTQEKALAALDALLAQAETAEALQAEKDSYGVFVSLETAEALQQRAEAAEAERDRYKKLAERKFGSLAYAVIDAEAERDTAVRERDSALLREVGLIDTAGDMRDERDAAVRALESELKRHGKTMSSLGDVARERDSAEANLHHREHELQQARDALVNIAKAAQAFGIGDSEWSRVEEALAALDEEAWTHEDRMVLGDGGC
jgi:hypothetical protein